MAPDLRPGPDSPPNDELQSAEETLAVLQHVLHTVASDDMSRRTPCSEYDVTQLTGHLARSITGLAGLVGADLPEPDPGDSAERQVITLARPALDAWHRHGLDGNVPFGKGEMPARGACGILSIEFLVHAWDYASAVGHDVDAPEPLAEYVLGLARQIIQPELRARAGFDEPVNVPADAGALDQLIAFTGRKPAASGHFRRACG